MEVRITGRHTEVPKNLKAYIEEKVGKLPRLYNRIMEVEVIIEGSEPEKKIEILAFVAGHDQFVAHENSEDLFACFDICMDRIEKQLRRFKDRVREKKHRHTEKEE